MSLSYAEENYLKSIYSITKHGDVKASTNDISADMQTKASSVTDMLKKLAKKGLIFYKAYQPVTLTELGRKTAISTIRKHRLWEVFLAEKLHFKWDEVHAIAEELEHIQSEKLINKLEEYLDYPTLDPHGDPIPNIHGEVQLHQNFTIADLQKHQFGKIIGFKDTSDDFLKYLDKTGLTLGKSVRVNEVNAYDNSVEVMLDMKVVQNISDQVANNIYIKNLTGR